MLENWTNRLQVNRPWALSESPRCVGNPYHEQTISKKNWTSYFLSKSACIYIIEYCLSFSFFHYKNNYKM